MAQLFLWLLGTFRADLAGEPITDFATDKVQSLLAYLTVETDRVHRRDGLADLFWPVVSRKNALLSLRQALYQLRQVLGERDEPTTAKEGSAHVTFLHIDRQTIQFNAESDHWVDVSAFSSLAETCAQHRHRRRATCLPCLQRMERMVALYEGEFLQGFSGDVSPVFEEWVVLKREWLHREAMEALAYLADYHERRNEVDQARAYARRQVQMEPWREEAHRQLMRLLAAAGQRSTALAQYKLCEEALTTELGVPPTEETTTLYDRIRRSKDDANRSLGSDRSQSLAVASVPFVGRKKELSDLGEMLSDPHCRLVTIVGPGGIGKTRLAFEAAEQQIGNFPNGVFVVSLASIDSPDLLTSAIADVIGLTFRERQDPESQLVNYLRGKEILLVLDGMEHILDGAQLLARILHHAHGVAILVTSRERLNLREEHVLTVGGLPFPARGEQVPTEWVAQSGGDPEYPTADMENYAAIALFVQQARLAHHQFSLSPRELPHVARITQLVDGLPLGVELAAAWTRVRSCRGIAEEIEHNLDILSTNLRNVPERQRSIRATFEHSWHLLSSEEKRLLARLAVFRGGFRPESATEVTGAPLGILLALVDKSLVHRTAPDRYDMHALLAQYAAEKLSEDPRELKESSLEHAQHYTALLRQHRDRLAEARGREDLHSLALEMENIRQAWRVAVAHDHAQEVELGLKSLYLFYDHQCRFREVIDLFAGAIKQWGDDSRHSRILGQLLAYQGAVFLQLSDYPSAKAALEESQPLLQNHNLSAERAFCLINLAILARRQGDYEETVRLSQNALALARSCEDPWGITHALLQLGMGRYRQGDVSEAQALLEESFAVASENGNPRLIIAPLNVLGDIACHRGDYAMGRAHLERCLTLTRELNDPAKIAVALNNLGTVFHVLEELDEAQAAYEESLEICHEIGDCEGQAIALSNLGEVACAAGNYAEAANCIRRGLAIGRDIDDQWTVMACLNSLGEIAIRIGDEAQAWDSFAEALEIAQTTQTLPFLLKVLVNLAELLAEDGDRGFAAEVLEVARLHRASEETTREKAGRLMGQVGFAPGETPVRPLQALVADAVVRTTTRRTRANRLDSDVVRAYPARLRERPGSDST